MVVVPRQETVRMPTILLAGIAMPVPIIRCVRRLLATAIASLICGAHDQCG